MADSEKPKPPESPTTARELDFDDEEDLATASPKPKTPGATSTLTAGQDSSNAGAEGATEAAAPAQPPRPVSPREQAETTLKEAFPSIDAAVVRAVLMASGGQVEPAFNALLGMSDPNAQKEEAPPPPPPRPQTQQQAPRARSQLEQDEIYARQLAEHYQNQDARRQYMQQRNQDPRAAQQSPNQMGYYDEDDRERSFIDDDLPVIRDNIKKGFLETQSKVNSFITNLRKKIDGEDEDDDVPPPQPPRRPTQQAGRSGDMGRRSGDHSRYDADPEVLGDDFTALQLKDETTTSRPGGRLHANPDLFKPTPATPGSGGGSERRVSFQDGPPETIDDTLYRGSPDPANRTPAGGNKSKWQPLASVEPDPVAEHDPFSLGDSDEEEPKKKDPKPEDAARLQKATAEAMADGIGSDKKSGGDAKAE